MSHLKVYKASAGSGKTFALTMEYFKIVFHAPKEYRHVLAVTFTNKATEEMKSRIIGELDKMAEGRESGYARELMDHLSCTEGQLQAKASELRTLILHDYSRLAVTTIDRFFQRVIKAFTHELGIFPGYNVELDSEFVLLRAVDGLMQRMSEDRELSRWITDLMEERVEEARSWSIKSKIYELGRELFGESYMLLDPALADRFNDRQYLKNYQAFLQRIIHSFENRLRQFGESGYRLIEENGLQCVDFKGGSRSFIHIFPKLREGELDKITETTRKAVDEPDNWVTKTAGSHIRSRVEALYPQLNSLLKQTLDYYDTGITAYTSAKQIYGNIYQLGILKDLSAEIRSYCEDRGVMLLSDTTRILHLLIGRNDTPFLYEKTGNYYHHILIDEFQDTSGMQWNNFRPLITNVLSEGGRGLLVGDVKQSIYRWRNGDWRLLAEQVDKDFETFGVDHVFLDKNWRSAPEIVDFNNLFFQTAAEKLKTLFDYENGEENDYSLLIEEAYKGLKQNPRRDFKGYVEIAFGGEKKEKESETLIMQQIVDAVTDYRTRGGQLSHCVILVRNGKEGARIADYLMKYNQSEGILSPVPFVSNDSLYLFSSVSVKLIISALYYILDPRDDVNRMVLLYNYFNLDSSRMELTSDELFRQILPEATSEWLELLGRQSGGSLFEQVEGIIEQLGLRTLQDEIPYLVAFQDMVFDYESTHSQSVPVFLEWWEKEKGKKVLSTSESTDALRILTIHKSKGLEFNTVILPFVAWELDDLRHERRIWGHNREAGFDALELVPLTYSTRLKESYFREEYLEEHLKAYVDNLNLLYVALTRAEKELYVFPYAPRITKEGKPADIGAFLFQAMEEVNDPAFSAGWDSEERHFSSGEKVLYAVPVQDDGTNAVSLQEYPIHHMDNRISIRYRYKELSDPEENSRSALDEGKLLHEIFSHIRNVDDISSAVDRVYQQGLIDLSDRSTVGEQVRHYLSQPDVAQWFNRDYQIINERDLLLPSGKKARPDRVMLKPGETVVLDYKFGKKEEPGYARQVGFYCKMLRELGYPHVKGYLWYVNLGKLMPVENH